MEDKGTKAKRRFVLLDRDGTLVEERNYLSDPDLVELIPGVARSLRRLAEIGLGLVVVTNQSAIGRGFFDLARLELIHRRLQDLLAAEGVRLDGIYFCPHTPADDCDCRKPRTGMVDRAARELGFDPKESFVVGDKASDIELGRRVGATTFWVRTGYGAEESVQGNVTADYVVDSLVDVAGIIERCLL